MSTLRSDMFPSFLIVLLGTVDCVTTMIGVLYFSAAELNPFMVDVVDTSIWAFFALKFLATFFIALTLSMGKRILKSAINRETKSFRFSNRLFKFAYGGIAIFLIVVVANNFIILMA